MDPEYHPAFGHPPRHDHHRRARRLLIGGTTALLFGVVSLYWSSEEFYGGGQAGIARIMGWAALGVGTLCLVVGSIAWFALDDDDDPDGD